MSTSSFFDIRMPDMDGETVMRKIRENPRLRQPVIVAQLLQPQKCAISS